MVKYNKHKRKYRWTVSVQISNNEIPDNEEPEVKTPPEIITEVIPPKEEGPEPENEIPNSLIDRKSTIKILPLGDSITNGGNGFPSYRKSLWHKLKNEGYSIDFLGSSKSFHGMAPVASDLDFDLDHEGHWAWEVGQIRDNIHTWLNDYNPDIVLIHLGTNDYSRGQTNKSTLSEMSEIFKALRDKNPNIIILIAKIIPMKNKDTAPFNSDLASWAKDQSTSISTVVVVDQYKNYNPTEDSYDNYHPNSFGEEKMAEKWFQAIDSL